MSSFYSEAELKNIGLKSYGKNVLISKNAQLYDVSQISIGNFVRIDDFCILSGNIKLGSYIHIAAYCGLYGKYGIYMDDFSGLSPRCTLFSASDDFSGDYLISPMTKTAHNNIQKGVISIGKYCQIGGDTVILPNTTLAEGSAIGAKSLVIYDTQEWCIYAGIPVKKIKPRKKGLLKFISEYEYIG